MFGSKLSRAFFGREKSEGAIAAKPDSGHTTSVALSDSIHLSPPLQHVFLNVRCLAAAGFPYAPFGTLENPYMKSECFLFVSPSMILGSFSASTFWSCANYIRQQMGPYTMLLLVIEVAGSRKRDVNPLFVCTWHQEA